MFALKLCIATTQAGRGTWQCPQENVVIAWHEYGPRPPSKCCQELASGHCKRNSTFFTMTCINANDHDASANRGRDGTTRPAPNGNDSAGALPNSQGPTRRRRVAIPNDHRSKHAPDLVQRRFVLESPPVVLAWRFHPTDSVFVRDKSRVREHNR